MQNTTSLQKVPQGFASLHSIDDGEEKAYWKLKEKKKRTKKEQENLVRLERKMHDETQADRQYAPVLSLWCPGEDSNLHRIAPTRPSSVRVYQFRHLGIGYRKIV